MSQHPHPHPHHNSKNKGLHKDWRTWVVVLLAIAGMLMYVLSDDESIQPGGPPQGEIDSPPVQAAP